MSEKKEEKTSWKFEIDMPIVTQFLNKLVHESQLALLKPKLLLIKGHHPMRWDQLSKISPKAKHFIF